MPEFAYHAVDRQGHATDGTMIATDEKQLERRLSEIGFWLIEAQVQAKKKRRSKRNKVPRRELIDFFNEMSALLTAGIPIADAISAMAEETEHMTLKHILEDIGVNVQSGNDVSSSFRNYPEVFSDQLCNLVQAGEHGGNLTETFKDLSEHLEWVERILGDVKQASIYPTMILLAVCGLIGIMFTLVVPTFSELFVEMELELPPLTKAVVGLGDFSQKYWWAVLAAALGTYTLARNIHKIDKSVAYQIDKAKLSLPIFGPILTMLAQSQFVHNLALMLKAGVPIIEALKLSKGLANNLVMDTAIESAEYAVENGDKLSSALRNHNVISSLTLRMIVVGEDSGQLDKTLQQVANRFDEEIPRQIKRVFGILEPMITLLLVAIVGLIAAAVFLPMFKLMSGMGV